MSDLTPAAALAILLTATLPPTPVTSAEGSPPPSSNADASAADAKSALREAIDAYLDHRWLAAPEARRATTRLADRLREAGCSPADVEAMIRADRTRYEAPPPPDRLVMVKGLVCEHVDYTTSFLLFVPDTYRVDRPAPLLLVGHGGNSAMSERYATQAALSGTVPWLQVVKEHGIILAAPLSERGWGPIGNSILLSLVSWTQRRIHIDPDRVYVTGHSMGGHLSWRSGIQLGDRWGAVAPMSGGYDYVENHAVFPLVNVPGYATFGATEPYGIRDHNRKIAAWMAEHRYDWKLVEKPGGHEIYPDELPKVARFLLDHPRDLYRRRVYAVGGSKVVFDATWKNDKWPEHTWNPQRPIPRSTFHWIRLSPQPEDTPKDRSPQRVWAENLGSNRIRIASRFARRLRVYLHPRMVDLSRPVEIVANGETVLRETVEPSLETMLDLVREFDDRGRIFHAAVDIEISSDAEVPEPRGEAPAPTSPLPESTEPSSPPDDANAR